MDVRMALEPAVIFGFMGAEVVENDMDLTARIFGGNLVHEVQELDPAPSLIVLAPHLAGSDVEGRKQGGGPVPL